jgi:hypothetical protein
MQENENMNDGIQLELVSQTGRLKQNQHKLTMINEDLTESQLLVRRIGSLMRRNKLVVGGVLCTITLIIVVALIVSIKNRVS